MGRRRSTYSRKKKINFKPIIIILLALVFFAAIGVKIFSSNDYTTQIEEILSSNILKTTGAVSNISSVDIKVYSNEGIKYTNKHENIIKLSSFDSSIQEDMGKVDAAKKMLENLGKLEEVETVNELSPKQNGYYWIDINLVAEEKTLIFKSEEDYNIDLYYDISEQKIYVKNKYYDEFSKKNNKSKLKTYKVDDEYKKLIEELSMSKK